MKVKVCLANNTTALIDGQQIGVVTVAPVLNSHGRPSNQIFAVRAACNGMRVAAFDNQKIAVNFAQWVMREFSPNELETAFNNSYRNQETAQDAFILDCINERSRHQSRLYSTGKGKLSRFQTTPPK